MNELERAQRVRDLHAQGLGRNAIAREVPCSPATVSAICTKLGLAFDRTAAEVATAARKTDARARRAELELLYLAEAKRLLRELRKPCTVYNFGGKDNTYEEQQHPEPDAAAKLKLVQASGTALDRALKIAEADSDTGVEAARSMLGSLSAGLRAAYDALPAPTADDTAA